MNPLSVLKFKYCSLPQLLIIKYKPIWVQVRTVLSLVACLLIVWEWREALVQTVESLLGLSQKIYPREFRRVIRLSWRAQPRGKVWWPEGTPVGKFFRQSLRTFHCFSDFWIKTVKIMRPRVAPRVDTEHIPVLLQWCLIVLNPDFTGVIRKCVYCLLAVWEGREDLFAVCSL